ncbi:MAG TPA: glycosyltransferase, partial [Solirubrobacteraceae bacterium]|nr:glycosyltransferase [Solirubrobacteraceae bacterium]
MIGMGWFPATLGGLNRYYRGLFEQLDEARGVVVGPAGDAPSSVAVMADGRSPLPYRLLRVWLAARREARGCDLLDAHFALYAAAPLLSGTARGRPIVFHFHGPWADESAAAGDASRLRHALRGALERRVHARVDVHVVMSSAFRRVLVERYRVRPWEIHVIPPGVALEVFSPADRDRSRERMKLARSGFVAVCTRRMVARMGLDVLIDAWGILHPDLPDGSALLLIGDGPLREALAQRVASSRLKESVHLLGRVSDAELVDAYRAADVAVVPSVALEGFGLVVLEAGACGTPSIVSDVGGLAETTELLDPSLVVPPGDSAALARRLLAARAGDLPTRGRTRSFCAGYSWGLAAERHADLYQRLLAGRRDERVRVVYLDHVARLSGGEIALMRVLPRMEKVNPHVILGEDGPLADRLVKAGVSVEVMPIAPSARDLRRDSVELGGVSAGTALQTLAYVARLALRIRKLAPDLVHTNSLKAGVYGSLAARLARIPLVWHVRDRVAEDYLPPGAARAVRAMVRTLASGVIANSSATLETLDRSGDALSWVIPASVEPPESAAAREARPSRPARTFGMLGRIAPWKGQDLFLRAFAEAFPDGEERAVLVGTTMFGEEGYERELHQLVSALGLGGRVEFRGFREDVWPELASFDVLVHASRIPEPFGTVVLEGMAAGLAVLAPDQGGPAAIITDGETGRLFRSGERDSLAEAMRSL